MRNLSTRLRIVGLPVVITAGLVVAQPGSVHAVDRAALQKVSPTGTITVKDDKAGSCFRISVTGSGFTPGIPVQLEVGTDESEGALKNDRATATPDEAGDFGPLSMTPCGITTHGAIESDHVCTERDIDDDSRNSWYQACTAGGGKGVVLTEGTRWTSSAVVLRASQDPDREQRTELEEQLTAPPLGASANAYEEWEDEQAKVGEELDKLPPPTEASVSWPLTVAG